MGGKAKGKHRLDKFYHLAKEHGYRSRAVWKLIQLDSKYTFLRSSNAVLDLCAAPGGWMQAAVERVPVGSLVIGVDLDPIRPIRGAIAIQEDITTPKCRATVKRLMSENGVRAFDLVLHDGSPNVGGAWAQEATSQNSLVIDSIKLASELLAPKGAFITKVFRSRDYNAVLYCLRQLFEKVEVDKPAASRSTSAEIYIVCLKYKAPAKIDPRLFDVRHLFQGGKEAPKVIDVLRGTKQKRHRDGYEDGDTTLRKTCTATDFIWSSAPLDILGSVTSINFSADTCLPIKDHALTTEEVKALCDDLRVLGKQDFKHLLKWRIHIRKALSPSEKETPKPTDAEPESKVDEDEDDDVLNEMEELTNAMLRKKKQAKKIVAKRRAKDKARKATGMQSDVMEDGYTDYELFSLSSIKGKKDLVAVDNTEDDNPNNEVVDSDDEGGRVGSQDESASDMDSEEERRRYDDQMEQLLEEAYEKYGDEDGDEAVHPDEDSDNDHADQETNPLMIPLDDDEPTEEEIAAKWFSQDVFDDGDEQQNSKMDESDDDEDEMQVDKKPDNQIMVPKKPTSKNPPKKPQPVPAAATEDFEIVPAIATDSSDDSSSDDSDDDDVETKAEILAVAKKMLRKKQREQMLDDAYNKYMFHDDEGLPKWFIDEEKKHMQPMKPITKEEVNAMKAQFKEINARPAKKVAQAKARKKRVAMRKMEKVRKKANSIADQADINDRSKMKMIDTLYKKAVPQRPKKELVVAKKGVQVRTGKGKVLVDRRMKKDARKHGMSKDKKEKGKKKGGKGQKGKGSAPPKGKTGRK
ncbi:Ribosomal RNA large subunit methyltransferase E [Cynara cardunculus var. scolymus]|uniref:Putative rRNA methyltransferase n=1 Tax=Cynara cardunculus var. scolymus TaxID=59895 RepID=A0A103XM60_CYNCS|nr:Ribosomal RNA large subunit methyltransferase E [Cynara cardunculus var. scolymus]